MFFYHFCSRNDPEDVDHHGRPRFEIYCKMNGKQGIVSESIVNQLKTHIWITSQARPALITPPPLIAFIPINPGGLLTPGGG
jgi:hypothetical protein